MRRKPFNPDHATGDAGPKPADHAPKGIVTVSQLTRLVKEAIETALPSTVHVVGQLSNLKRHTSGHLYFTLKDEHSELSCVMWRSHAERMRFKPTDGTDVVVSGVLSVFERSGRYQLYARKMEPRGIGALELAFRQLWEKLQGEGLFDKKHKKPLPKYPQRIAVVTSESGAAVADILDTLKRRYPCATVFLHPVAVQGAGAAGAVAAAVRNINRRSESLGRIDVMIVGRGGGSAEDLWTFNEEGVARAIFASRIPVISAVGHETDVTVADLVADVRAATPTAAAELAVPQAAEVRDELAYHEAAIARVIRHRLRLGAAQIQSLTHRRGFADAELPVRDRRRRMEQLCARISTAPMDCIHRLRRQVGELALVLHRLHPPRFLAWQNGRVVTGEHRLRFTLARCLAAADRLVATRTERLVGASPAKHVGAHSQRIDGLARRMRLAAAQVLERGAARLDAEEARLGALDYRSTLARGFSITRGRKTGKVISSVGALRDGDRLLTELADGSVESRVVDADQGELFD